MARYEKEKLKNLNFRKLILSSISCFDFLKISRRRISRRRISTQSAVFQLLWGEFHFILIRLTILTKKNDWNYSIQEFVEIESWLLLIFVLIKNQSFVIPLSFNYKENRCLIGLNKVINQINRKWTVESYDSFNKFRSKRFCNICWNSQSLFVRPFFTVAW